MSDRLVIDWTHRGLIDQPGGHRSLGRPRGFEKGTWRWEQRQLFLLLLRKRRELSQQPRSDFRLLYNIPVFLWLWFGDAYVPLRQTRTALRSWLHGANRVSKEYADRAARDIVRRMADPESPREAKAMLADVLAQALREGDIDRRQLKEALAKVLDPKRTGTDRGPEGASISPSKFAHILEARVVASVYLDVLADPVFERSRTVYRRSRREYSDRWKGFAEDPDIGQMFEEPTDQQVLLESCWDLLTILGMAKMKEL